MILYQVFHTPVTIISWMNILLYLIRVQTSPSDCELNLKWNMSTWVVIKYSEYVKYVK